MRILRSFRPGWLVAGALALAIAMLAAGCGAPQQIIAGGGGGGTLTAASRVVISPKLDTLSVGGAVQLSAAAYDSHGALLTSLHFGWTSTPPGVCSVTTNGLVTGLAEGAALVIATGGGRSDTALVYVRTTVAGWNTQTSNTAQNLNAVHFLADGRTGFAVGDAGVFVHTTDGGASWSVGTSGTTNDLEGVWMTSALVGWTVGKAGTVMKSTDGGATWTRQVNVGSANNFLGVCFVDANHGWVVGANGTIAITANGGTSWSLRFPTAQTLYGVAFSDASNGWACGGGGVIVGTHDGGNSWYIVQPALTVQNFKSVSRTGATRAVAVGAQGVVGVSTATTDSLAWALGNAGAANQLDGVCMVGASLGWAVGSNPAGLVLATTDGGGTWTAQTANSTQPLHGVWFVDPLRGWAVGGAGRIVHTGTGGAP